MVAWNPVTQQEGWRIQGGSAGMLATAGGTGFQGQKRHPAYDATGAELWKSPDVHTGIVAAPVTFEHEGEQYVAVVAGRSTTYYYAPDYSRLLVFKLGGNGEQSPPPIEFTMPELNPPPSVAAPEQIARGREHLPGQLHHLPR